LPDSRERLGTAVRALPGRSSSAVPAGRGQPAVRLGLLVAQSEQRMQKLEHQHGLTGLPNHDRFFELLNQALARRREEEALVFGAIDLDGFVEVTEALGHAGGDEVMVEIARRLHDLLPPNAVIGRLGSDEFALMLPGAGHAAALATVAAMRRALARPIGIDRVVAVGASIGLAIAPVDARSV
jgi:diguanylate cyclase (GGDEF)-like protein